MSRTFLFSLFICRFLPYCKIQAVQAVRRSVVQVQRSVAGTHKQLIPDKVPNEVYLTVQRRFFCCVSLFCSLLMPFLVLFSPFC